MTVISPEGNTLYPTWFRWNEKNICMYRRIKDYFISHMVQMKRSGTPPEDYKSPPLYPTWFRWNLAKSFWRYPMSWTLYPTWFRWNRPANLADNRYLGFISHMVQMKPIPRKKYNSQICCFISHMVQMKQIHNFKICGRCCKLYIPHGSDETRIQELLYSRTNTFISHMVQMKPLKDPWQRYSGRSLYPTWFRWNFATLAKASFVESTLYPTWFRWN